MRGVPQGQENARRLEAYLDALERDKLPLPARDGKPNLSVIALACGFDRGVLYTNAAAKSAITAAAARLGLEAFEQRAPESVCAPDPRDQRILKLEQENAALRAENIDLRRRVKRLEHVESHMAETGRRVAR